MDEHVVTMSEPVKTLEMDIDQSRNAEIDLQDATELAAKHGVIFWSPEKTARRLPDYPGYGADLT